MIKILKKKIGKYFEYLNDYKRITNDYDCK